MILAAMTLDLIVKVTLLLAAIWLVVRLFRTPSLRHFTRSLTLTAILLLPVLVAVLPARNLAILPPSMPASQPIPNANANEGIVTPVTAASANFVFDLAVPVEKQSFSWPALLWGIGVLLCLTRLAVGFYGLSRHRGVPYEPNGVDLDELAGRIGLRKAPEVRLAASHDLVTAMTWGVIAPVVQLPLDSRTWSQERLEAVLLHEFAHVRRYDFLSGLLGQVACALYWFHPIVWLCARAARADAESAADDAVLRSGVRPSNYAAELLGLAAELDDKRRHRLSLGVTLMNEPKIESRLKSVLSPRALRRGMTRPQALVLLAAATLTVPALAGLRAVASERTPQQRTAVMQHAKGIALATMIYAQDYDMVFPNAKSTAAAWKGIEPYAKSVSRSVDAPLTGPGGLVFNANLSKVSLSAIPAPAETPMWVEKLADLKEPFAVAYVDGHVHIRNASERSAVEKALRLRFPSAPVARRVPANQATRAGGVGN